MMVLPGTLWNAELTRTSIVGMRYDARPLTCVLNGGSTWQYGFNCAPRTTVIGVFTFALSGSAALTAQLSVDVRPVLVPPWKVSCSPTRALTFTSTPFQCWICLSPRLSDRFTRLSV